MKPCHQALQVLIGMIRYDEVHQGMQRYTCPKSDDSEIQSSHMLHPSPACDLLLPITAELLAVVAELVLAICAGTAQEVLVRDGATLGVATVAKLDSAAIG